MNVSKILFSILGFILLSLPAKAGLITQWGFEVDSGFTSYDPAALITGSNTNTHWNAPSTLTWGGGAAPSSFDVGGATNGNFTGDLFTDGAAVNTVSLTHTNNPIPAGTSLTSATLSDRIFLTPMDGVGNPVAPGFAPPSLIFDITFEETPNSGPCAVTTSPTPCNDIFILDVAGAGFNPLNNTLNQNFMYDGIAYNARLFIDGLGILEDSACTAAGEAIGCIGFTTVERETNTFQVALDITSRPFDVPEPSSIAILAVALLSLVRSKKGQF